MKLHKSVLPMQTAKIGYICLSVLLVIAGILLIANPTVSVTVVGNIVAVAMILFGIFKIIGYLSKDLYRLAFEYDFAFGILLIILGIIELSKPGTMLTVLCITFGIAVLADGLFKIQISMNAKPFGIKQWWLILVIAIAMVIIGVLLILKPFEAGTALMVLLGIATTIEGVLNLITVLTTVKVIKHQRPDVFDTEYREIS